MSNEKAEYYKSQLKQIHQSTSATKLSRKELEVISDRCECAIKELRSDCVSEQFKKNTRYILTLLFARFYLANAQVYYKIKQHQKHLANLLDGIITIKAIPQDCVSSRGLDYKNKY